MPRKKSTSIVPALTQGLSGIRLDLKGPMPYWRQLYAQITALIETGAIAVGGNLPAERELAQALGISRATVKRCYDELRQTRMLAGKGRSGSVVQSTVRVRPALGRLKGFTDEMQELGMTASTKVVACKVVRDRVIASIFGRSSDAQFLHLVRIRKGNETPMTSERAWYDLTLAPKLAGWNGQGSAYAFLKEQCGVELVWAEQTVEAVLSSAQETKAFGFDKPMPCLLFKRRSYAASGAIAEYVEGTFRGDAYVYRLRLEP